MSFPQCLCTSRTLALVTLFPLGKFPSRCEPNSPPIPALSRDLDAIVLQLSLSQFCHVE